MGNARTGRLHIRTSEEERVAWVIRARSEGKELSVWIREVLGRAAGLLAPLPQPLTPGLPDLQEIFPELPSPAAQPSEKPKQISDGKRQLKEQCFRCSRCDRTGKPWEKVENCPDCIYKE